MIGLGLEFPPAVVPKLAGNGTLGSGTSIADPLSGTASSATLVSAFFNDRPTGSSTTAVSWNGTVTAPNAPSTINGQANWEWVNGAFSLPNPEWTIANSQPWAAFSFTVEATSPPVPRHTYGYYERTYTLPGFDPLSGYLKNLGGLNQQIPTLSSDSRQPGGIYYVDNSSNFDILYLSNATRHTIAHVVPLFQAYPSYNEMLDNEFFVEYGYDQALFFGTATSSGSTYSIELVNLTSGLTRIWNTSAAVDGTNQGADYVGNNTVLVLSSNCSILAWNLSSHTEWSAGTLGAGFGSVCFEANNAYWFPQKEQIINVDAGGDTTDHVEQLNATFNGQGQIHFASVASIAVDSGVRYNWVNGLAYNASTGEIAFTAGYWVANTVYTYVVPYGSNGRITTTGETRYSVDNSGTPTGRFLSIQRYVFADDYMVGQSYGPGTWTNGTQLLFDPWNGSLLKANRSLQVNVPCGNDCFEGEYAPGPAYQLDYNATLRLNSPMWRVVYAYHNASAPNPTASLSLNPATGPIGTVVTLTGSGYALGAIYTYCFRATATVCSSGSTFTSTGTGAIPPSTTITVPSSGNAYVDVSNGTTIVAVAAFTVTSGSEGGGTGKLLPPTDLAAVSGSTCDAVVLTWMNPVPPNGSAVIDDTVLVYSEAGTALSTLDTGGKVSAFTVTGLGCGVTYQFRTQAYFANDTPSPLSAAVVFTTASLPGSTAGAGSGGSTGGTAASFIEDHPYLIAALIVGLFLLGLFALILSAEGRGHHKSSRER